MPTTTPEILDLYVAELYPADDNPRRHLGDLTGLTASIKAVGVLEPLVVTPIDGTEPTGYRIVAGHRRAAAAKKAKLTSVPCIIRPALTDAERVEIMVIENLQREGLAPLEEAAAFEQLTGLGWTQKKIAERTGCTQSHVSKRLALLKLPDAAREAVDNGTLTVEIGVELTKLDDGAVKKLLLRGSNVSKYDVQRAIDAAAQKRKLDKLYAPHEKKGLKRVEDMYWHGKWEECTERLATAVHISPYSDRVTFLCEKVAQPKSPTAKREAAKETPAQKRERLKREKRTGTRRAAAHALVHDDQADLWTVLAAMVIDAGDCDLAVAAGHLGIPIPDGIDDKDYKVSGAAIHELSQRIEAYAAVDTVHARRVVAAFVADTDFWLGQPGTGLMTGLLIERGYDTLAHETEEAARARDQWAQARERGYLPPPTCRICQTEGLAIGGGEVCNACTDLVGTVHDPDAPVSAREVLDEQAKRDAKFVDDNQLQVGDVVDDDGTITRTDEISTAAPDHEPENASENQAGTNGKGKRTSTRTAAA